MRSSPPTQHRRLDLAGFTLLLVGLLGLAFSSLLIARAGFNAAVLIPSLAAVLTGMAHVTKLEVR